MSLYVARADGSGLTLVTPKASRRHDRLFASAPDGRELLISARVNGMSSVLIAAVDGSGIRQLDVGRPAIDASWRPPLGNEIMFTDCCNVTDGFYGMYVISAKGGTVRHDPRADAGRYRGFAAWSPDGITDRLFGAVRLDRPDGPHPPDQRRRDRRPCPAHPRAGAVWDRGTRLVEGRDPARLSIRGYDGSNDSVGRSSDRRRTVSGTGVEHRLTPETSLRRAAPPGNGRRTDSSILGTPDGAEPATRRPADPARSAGELATRQATAGRPGRTAANA